MKGNDQKETESLKRVLNDAIFMVKKRVPRQTIISNLMFIIERELPRVSQKNMAPAAYWFYEKAIKRVEEQKKSA